MRGKHQRRLSAATEASALLAVPVLVKMLDGDRNHLVLLFEYDSIDNVKTFVASDALREAMGRAGVQGEPAIYVVNAGDSGKP